MAAKKKAALAEEVQNAQQTVQNDAQDVKEATPTQTPTEKENATEASKTSSESETPPTDLSDAPAEIKDEILKNAEALDGQTPEPDEAPAEPEAIPLTIDEIEELVLPGDADDQDQQQDKRWSITDDGCADWALKKIKTEKDELDRLTELAQNEIARLQDKLQKAQRRYEQNTAFLTSMLSQYFDTVPHKTTKTGTESYQLLNGKLVLKPAGIKAEADDEQLVAWLRQNGMEDMIKVEEKAKWGDLKKKLRFVGTVATIEETGELVEGVKAVETPATFSVKF